jgi:hypothetical protein
MTMYSTLIQMMMTIYFDVCKISFPSKTAPLHLG